MWGPKTLVLGTNRQDQLLGVLDPSGGCSDKGAKCLFRQALLSSPFSYSLSFAALSPS